MKNTKLKTKLLRVAGKTVDTIHLKDLKKNPHIKPMPNSRFFRNTQFPDELYVEIS